MKRNKKCIKCGHSGLESKQPPVYHYTISGLDNVYLRGGVTVFMCPKCGERATSIKNVIGLHQVIAGSLATAKRRLSGKELRFLREQLGFSAEDLALLLEYNEDHVRNIEAGTNIPKAPYEMFLRVAVMRGMKAPEYDLRELSDRRDYKIEDLQFVNKTKEWELDIAA